MDGPLCEEWLGEAKAERPFSKRKFMDDYVFDDPELGYDSSPGGLAVADTGKNNSSGVWGVIGNTASTGTTGFLSLLTGQQNNKAATNQAKIKAGTLITIALYVVGGLIVIAGIGFLIKRRK
jgi:hypothetical protein